MIAAYCFPPSDPSRMPECQLDGLVDGEERVLGEDVLVKQPREYNLATKNMFIYGALDESSNKIFVLLAQ